MIIENKAETCRDYERNGNQQSPITHTDRLRRLGQSEMKMACGGGPENSGNMHL